MALNTTAKKSNVISRTASVADRLLSLMSEARELRQEALDSGFGTGGADAIIDADFVGDNAHINLSRLLDAFTVFAALDTALAANTRQHYIRLQLLRG